MLLLVLVLLVLLVLLVVGGVGDGWWLSLQDSGGAHAAASSSMANAGEHGKVWREVEIVYARPLLALVARNWGKFLTLPLGECMRRRQALCSR